MGKFIVGSLILTWLYAAVLIIKWNIKCELPLRDIVNAVLINMILTTTAVLMFLSK